MSAQDNLYDEISSLRRLCNEQVDKQTEIERGINELISALDDAILHLKAANPYQWMEESEIYFATYWCNERDMLVEYLSDLRDKHIS